MKRVLLLGIICFSLQVLNVQSNETNLEINANEIQLIDFEKLPMDTISDGIRRQWIHGAKGQMAYFHLKKGAHIPMHSHPNEQITYIIDGKVKIKTFYKEKPVEYIVKKGQVIIFPENVPHEFFALENTLDLDVHVPVRQDWLTNELPDYLKKSK